MIVPNKLFISFQIIRYSGSSRVKSDRR